MKIKAIRPIKSVTVPLDRYFDEPTSVIIRPLSTVARAKIQELTASGVRISTSTVKKGQKVPDIQTIEQTMPAETLLEIRRVKLSDGVVDHTIVDEDGKKPAWSEELWNALDDADPNLLAMVIDKITDLSYPDDEGDGVRDPT
jgi:hypothetical protein